MPPPACHNAARSWGVQPDYGGGVGTGVSDFGGGAGGGDDGGWRGRASNAARVRGPKTMPAATDVGRGGSTRSRTRRDVERRGCMKVRKDCAMAWSCWSEKVASSSKVMVRVRESIVNRSRSGKATSMSAKSSRPSMLESEG